MNRFFRPSLSDSRPNTRAPMTSPIRYHHAMSETAPADMLSVLCMVRSGPTLLAMVISSPSRIQATPSAITSRVWNFDQGNRSIRAGIRLLMRGLLVVVDVVAMVRSSLSRPTGPLGYRAVFGPCYPRIPGAHLSVSVRRQPCFSAFDQRGSGDPIAGTAVTNEEDRSDKGNRGAPPLAARHEPDRTARRFQGGDTAGAEHRCRAGQRHRRHLAGPLGSVTRPGLKRAPASR